MPWPTDPRFASYFLPGYPAALAAVMAAMRSSSSPACGFPNSAAASDYSPGATGGGGGGFLSGLASSNTSPSAPAVPPQSNSTFYTPSWDSQGPLGTGTGASAFGSPSATGGDEYLNADTQRATSNDESGQANTFGRRSSSSFYLNRSHPSCTGSEAISQRIFTLDIVSFVIASASINLVNEEEDNDIGSMLEAILVNKLGALIGTDASACCPNLTARWLRLDIVWLEGEPSYPRIETNRDVASLLPGSRLPHFLSNPFNPFMPFYHTPLRGLSSSPGTPKTVSDRLRNPSIDRLVDGQESVQNSSGLKAGLGGYPGAMHSSSDFWRGGGSGTPDSSSSSFRPTIPSASAGGRASTASTTAPPSTNSSSLYAAVMAAAAVASWGGQSISTATSAVDSLAPGTNTAALTALGKSHVDANVVARKNKPIDSAKNPYSPSMFAAAAAAHMHFLSAAAAAASFTSSLPIVPTDNSTTTTTSATTANSITSNLPRSSTESALASPLSNTPSGLGRMSASSTTPKSFDLGRQNSSRKSNRDFESVMVTSPQDDASSEPDGGRLVSQLKKTHIKKPLNAFMLFMKEMRPRVQEECTLKESAAINQILGKKWHELSRAEQTKYYEMARQAKELHQRLYPGWSARDNYAYHARRRHRRSRRAFPHHRSFISTKTTSSSSTVNTLAKASPIGPLRSSSFHEERKGLDLPQKLLDRPHSASDIYSPTLERRLASSSPLTPPPPPPAPPPPPPSQSPVTTSTSSSNRVSDNQPVVPQAIPRPMVPSQSVIPPPSSAAFVPPSQLQPPPLQQGFVRSTRPTQTLANNVLTMSACSAFEQHYNQATHQPPPNHSQQQQYLQMSSQRGFGYPPSSTMYGQGARGGVGVISRSPAGYWGYQSGQINPLQSGSVGVGVKRNPYLNAATAMNSDSVAAVAAVAAMAVGELSGGSMKKCRARFGLEHQNLWCKPCRRKKKCIRFISENEVEDYMSHHGHHPLSHHEVQPPHVSTHPTHPAYQSHSAAAAAAAAAAVAFNHHHHPPPPPPHHQLQLPPHSSQSGPQGDPYGMFSNTGRRHAAAVSGAAPYSIQKPPQQNFMSSSFAGSGNGVPGIQAQRPTTYSRQPMLQHFPGPTYAQLALGDSGYKRQFPMTSSAVSRQQQQPSDFARSQTPVYRSNTVDNANDYWASNSRSGSAAVPTFSTNLPSSRFSASEMMLSQGEPKSQLLRETQGSNSSNTSTSTYPKMMNNNFPTHPQAQQGTTSSSSPTMVGGSTTTKVSTNGGGEDSRIKREAPPLSFGVADVMGFKTTSREEAPNPTFNAATTTTATTTTSTSNSTVYRGNASPSTSSCPLRSSPELE
ncbi:hypothetical protein Aperf_G00000112295 [Anoplocephala perfoliata]